MTKREFDEILKSNKQLANSQFVASEMTSECHTYVRASFVCQNPNYLLVFYGAYYLIKFEGGLNLLHKADDDAVLWLEYTATAALTK